MEEFRSAVGALVPAGTGTQEAPPADVATMRAHDEEEALRVRELYRISGIPSLAPDPRVTPYLATDERLLGAREPAAVRRVDEEMRLVVRHEGSLYITDRRLIHVGERVDSIPLAEIDELTMDDDRIFVTLIGARGVTLDISAPNQLRVLIAAAKAALRSHPEPERSTA